MGQFRDALPTHQSWLHELGQAEIHPEAEKLLQLGGGFDPQQAVEESAIGFLTHLKDKLSEYARLFNTYSEAGTRFQEIKVYTIAQTAADFMLFRNQVKLVFSNAASGMIQISFAQHARGTFAVNGQDNTQSTSPQGSQVNELLAQIGPFRNVFWTFQGERVCEEDIAKFYFTEFAKMTRDRRPSRAGNQVLLDQIKALLHEKGLDL